VEQGQTPYQRILTPPQAGARPAAPPRPPVAPVRPAPEQVKKSSSIPKIPKLLSKLGGTGGKAMPGTDMIDKDTGRRMAIIALGFLVFYLLLMWAILKNDLNNGLSSAQNEHRSQTATYAQNISTAIDNTIVSIDNGLKESSSPAQAARIIANSPGVSAAALLNQEKRLIGLYPQDARFLSNSPLENIDANKAQVDSVVMKDGTIVPMVIKYTGNYFVVAAISPGTFVRPTGANSSEKTVLISQSRKVIDGSKEFGIAGASEVYGLSADRIGLMTKPKKQTAGIIKIKGDQHQFSSANVNNSNLYLLKANMVTKSAVSKKNLLLFLTLFLGISTLIGLLLNSLYTQIKSLRQVQKNTEVSQQRFRAAVEGDRGGVWELDLVNNMAYLSASLAALLGMSRQEQQMQMSQFLGLFHAQDREKFLSSARRAHMNGEFDFDMNVAHLPLILQCRGRPSTRSGSEANRVIVGVALDITEQRGAQARLVSAETRLHGALSSMTDSFVIWDAMKRLVLWNIRFEDFFGLQPGQLQQGMEQAGVEYLVGPSIAEVIDTNSPDGAVEIKLNDGRWIRYIETQTAEGGHVSIGTNITEIRMREAELRENEHALQNTVGILRKSQEGIFELAQRYEEEKIRAEDANQSKSDFLANMSHELRTPLNAINGFSDIMQKEMFGPLGDPRYKEYVNDILFSGQHLLALINDILDMSKIEAGKMSLNTEIMFMHEMISQVVRIVRGRAEEAQLNLKIVGSDVNEIEADPRAVKQVLLNLLTNAIKFTPENGTVQVQLIQKKTGLIVKVTDSGIGISQENIERLAKPFEQVVDQSTTHKEGTGLGLALSKSLIELHGGNFKIESVLGQGTTVIFSLPNKPIIRKEEAKENQVTQEISRLASDIASVLAESDAQLSQSTATDAPSTPPPNPYDQAAPAEPEQAYAEFPSDRPAA